MHRVQRARSRPQRDVLRFTNETRRHRPQAAVYVCRAFHHTAWPRSRMTSTQHRAGTVSHTKFAGLSAKPVMQCFRLDASGLVETAPCICLQSTRVGHVLRVLLRTPVTSGTMGRLVTERPDARRGPDASNPVDQWLFDPLNVKGAAPLRQACRFVTPCIAGSADFAMDSIMHIHDSSHEKPSCTRCLN